MVKVEVELTEAETEWLRDQIEQLNMTGQMRPLYDMCQKLGVLFLKGLYEQSRTASSS